MCSTSHFYPQELRSNITLASKLKRIIKNGIGKSCVIALANWMSEGLDKVIKKQVRRTTGVHAVHPMRVAHVCQLKLLVSTRFARYRMGYSQK